VGFLVIGQQGTQTEGPQGTAEEQETAMLTQLQRPSVLPPLSGLPSGEAPVLTPRQRDILSFIAQGRSNKQIAFALGIRERTVKFHIAALFERLGTSSRTEALVVALRTGVIQLDPTA
jgi:DNA-binding NarL/FixJ family response regulator